MPRIPSTLRKTPEGNDNTYQLPRGEAIRRAMATHFRQQRNAVLAFLREGANAEFGHKANDATTETQQLPSRFPGWDAFKLGALALSERMTPLISAIWDRAGATFAPRVGLDPNAWSVVNPHTEPMIAAAAFRFCQSTNEATSLQLDDALHKLKVSMIEGVVEEGETLPQLTRRVKEIFDKLETSKARSIAQTEASRAVHSAQEQAAYASKVVTGWHWEASADACPEICLAIVARCPNVRLGETFAIVGHNPHYSEIKFAPAHPCCNCTCVEILITDPQPDWGTTQYQPHAATDDELDAIAARENDRLNDVQRTWDPDTGLYGGTPTAPSPAPTRSTPSKKPKQPRPRPAAKPKPAPPKKPRKPQEQEQGVSTEQVPQVAVAVPPWPGEPIPARDDTLDPVPTMTVEHFAGEATDAAFQVPMAQRFNDRLVWIVDAFFKFLKEHPGASMAAFKRKLSEANNARLITLSRSDLPGALTDAQREKEEASEVHQLAGLFHFIRLPTATKPKPAQQAPPAAPKFGRSTANVELVTPDHTPDDYAKAAKAILGQRATIQDLASVAGATDDAVVKAALKEDGLNGPEIELDASTQEYETARKIRMDYGGRSYMIAKQFYVAEKYQGKGIYGPQVFGRMVENAIRLGLSHIETTAGQGEFENGYYTWARFGYDAPIPKELRGLLPGSLAPAKRLSDLMATEEGTTWWKKHGITTRMVFDLAPGSLSRQIWDAYLAAKAAK